MKSFPFERHNLTNGRGGTSFSGQKVLDHLGLIVILPLLTQLKLIRVMVSIIKLV